MHTLHENGCSYLVDSEQPLRVDAFLATQLGRSRAFIQAQIANHRVRVNGEQAVRASMRVQTGDEVFAEITEDTTIPGLKPVPGDLDVLFEDEHLLVINKPQGMVVHPAPGTLGSTLVHHLLHYLQNVPNFSELSATRPGIVHRLDRGTSGVILVAKSQQTHERLGKQFHDREVRKRYEAIVWGRTEDAGTISSMIGRSRQDPKKMTSSARGGKPALTAWKTQASTEHFSHIWLFPKTGRTHQLRVHLADLGHPIVGDPTYKRSDFFRKLPLMEPAMQDCVRHTVFPYLHAAALEFKHPMTGAEMSFQAPRPAIFSNFLRTIGL